MTGVTIIARIRNMAGRLGFRSISARYMTSTALTCYYSYMVINRTCKSSKSRFMTRITWCCCRNMESRLAYGVGAIVTIGTHKESARVIEASRNPGACAMAAVA